jgi:hypothetical protein
MTFLTERERITLKFIWKHKRFKIAKAILSKKSNAEGFTIFNFKFYYRLVVTKINKKETGGKVIRISNKK